MAELRRHDDLRYTTQADIQNAREGVFVNEDETIENLNRPRLVDSATAMENEQSRTFDNQEASATSRTYSNQSMGNTTVSTPLFSAADVEDLRMRWGKVQTGFVDEPRWAVQEADKLVARTMDCLTEGFANERSSLEKQWGRGDAASTEELRLAFQRYRTFFDRLLNV